MKEAIDYLNNSAGTSFKHGTKKADSHINARISEGATLNDFMLAIDNMVKRWKGTEQEMYLRPETLFGNKFWGYVNAKSTDVTSSSDRRELLKEVLRVAGIKDITEATITIYGEIMKMVQTSELPQFAVQLIRNGGVMMRPDQMISEAVKKHEQKIITNRLQSGGRISDYDRFVEFVQYSFRGKPITNGAWIFKDFVIISMDRDGNMVNNMTWKKLSSQDEIEVYKWLFENQNRVGVVEHVEQKTEVVQIENKKEDSQIEVANKYVGDAIKTLADDKRA